MFLQQSRRAWLCYYTPALRDVHRLLRARQMPGRRGCHLATDGSSQTQCVRVTTERLALLCVSSPDEVCSNGQHPQPDDQDRAKLGRAHAAAGRKKHGRGLRGRLRLMRTVRFLRSRGRARRCRRWRGWARRRRGWRCRARRRRGWRRRARRQGRLLQQWRDRSNSLCGHERPLAGKADKANQPQCAQDDGRAHWRTNAAATQAARSDGRLISRHGHVHSFWIDASVAAHS
jgi:hypothetical protein